MIETDWKWYNGKDTQVPDIEDLRVQARALLTRAIWEESSVTNVGTGGFMAYKLPWGLSLTFQIRSSNA